MIHDTPTRPMHSRTPFEIIVAHYQEDLEWLTPVAELVTIYTKGDPESLVHTPAFANTIVLPNIGRESHSYLYHIVNNYDCLADVTLFTQGQVLEHVGPDVSILQMIDVCRKLPHEPLIAYTTHGLKRFDAWSGIVHVKKWKEEQESGVMRSASDTPGDFWKWVFGTEPPSVITFWWGAIFAVHAESIRRWPKDFYERLLRRLEEVNHVNPEEGHYMERLWLNIFVPDILAVPVMPCNPDVSGIKSLAQNERFPEKTDLNVSLDPRVQFLNVFSS